MKDDIKKELQDKSRDDLEDEYNDRELSNCIDIEFKRKMAGQNKKQEQEALLEDVSQNIWKTTKQFDLDSTQKNSPFDILVQRNVLQKTLEQDNLIYLEGIRSAQQPEFMTVEEF